MLWRGLFLPLKDARLLLVLMALSALLVAYAAYSSRKSTLAAPLLWCLGAVVAVGIVAAGRSLNATEPVLLTPWEFVLGCLVLGPVIAVMGSKRPQHLGWNFIVLSLWGVAALPALETYFINPDQRLFVGPWRGMMLWVLIALTLVNFLPTRFGWCALLLTAGEILFFAEYLPFLKPWQANWQMDNVAVGSLLMLLVPWLAAMQVAWNNLGKQPPPLNATWLRFRDSFGLLWGLRFVERVNEVADAAKMPLWLSWSGFRHRETGKLLTQADWQELPPAVASSLRHAMHGMLRRFWPATEVANALRELTSSSPSK